MNEEKDKYGKILKNILEFGGASIILFTIIYFFAVAFLNLYEKSDVRESLAPIEVNFSHIETINDSSNFILFDKEIIRQYGTTLDSLNQTILQLNELNKQMKITQNENNEKLRFYLSILGIVFAIVGFFGFKSVYDSRAISIEKAGIEATNVADKTAARVSKETTQNLVENYFSENFDRLLEKKVNDYLDENLGEKLKIVEDIVLKDIKKDYDKLEKNIDSISRADIYPENEQPLFYRKLNETNAEIINEIKTIREEIEKFKSEELKKSILLELRQTKLTPDDKI